MEQLSFRLSNPQRLDVDGILDEKTGIMYIGKATQQYNGTWRCVANVYGSLCIVKAKIKFDKNEIDNTIIV